MDFFGVGLENLIRTIGYLGLFAIIFAETGLLLGFFLPGDSLLFVAGLLAAEGALNIWAVIFLVVVAAVLGNLCGYGFGMKMGITLFHKEDSLLFKKSHATKAQSFYDRYGIKTVMLARFVPAVRTFAPIVAGVARMDFRSFMFYNILGAIVWAFLLTFLGYWLGDTVPHIERYVLQIVGLIIALSLLPGLFQYWKEGSKT